MVMLRMPHYYGWDRMKELVIFVFNINKIDTESYGFLQDIGNYKFYNTYECTILLICFLRKKSQSYCIIDIKST